VGFFLVYLGGGYFIYLLFGVSYLYSLVSFLCGGGLFGWGRWGYAGRIGISRLAWSRRRSTLRVSTRGDQTAFQAVASRLPNSSFTNHSVSMRAPANLCNTRPPPRNRVRTAQHGARERDPERFRGPVELMQLKHGIFDDASVVSDSRTTIDTICS
jgi:hypothetical protein